MKLIPLPIKDAFIIEFRQFHDNRGYLQEIYNEQKVPSEIEKFFPVKQNTLARSKKNVLRGLHASPYCKLMTCAKGEIYDVIVDLRPDSPTYLRWVAVVLSDTNCRQMFVPPCCGHGYLSMGDDTIVMYVQGGSYDPPNERGITPFDPIADVHWPLSNGAAPLLSDKDKAAPNFTDPSGVQPKRKRVLILGASGQVGGALQEVLDKHRGKYVYYGTYNEHSQPYMTPFHFEQAAKDISYCDNIMMMCRPHVVYICTAFSWVDGNERFPEKAEAVNLTAVEMVTRAANNVNAKVVFFSSDYVFSGIENNNNNNIEVRLLSEKQATDPVSRYGELKARAEQAVLKLQPTALVLRTSRVFGPEIQGKNFVYQIVKADKEGRQIKCLTEEISCATYNRDLARAAFELVEMGASGIFHCCGTEPMSKYEWGLQIVKHLNLSSTTVQPLELSKKPPAEGVARRPTFVPMSTHKLRQKLPDFRFHTLKEALADWQHKPRGKLVLQ